MDMFMESDTLSCISTLTTDTTEEDVSAERYGRLLLCPVCDQLLTHPVLLPCQHSVCYGCARSQILAQEIEENSSQCETPTQINGSRSSSSHSAERIPRRLTSTPSESSKTPKCWNSQNGNMASPALHTRSSSSLSESSHHTSLSTKDAGYESSMSENQTTFVTRKKKSHTSHVRGALPKFYSSPKPTNTFSSRRLASSQSTSVLTPPCHKAESPDNKLCNASSYELDVTMESEISCRSGVCDTSNLQKSENESHKFTHLKQSSRTSPSANAGMRRSTSASIVAGRFSFRSNQRIESSVLKKSKVSSLFCPTCEGAVQLGKLGIKGLFRNFALESIVDRYRTAARAVEAIRCGYCKPPASDATRSCLDCKLSYCNQCYKIVHIWGTKKAQHEFVGPTSNFSRPKVMLCPEHGNEAITMYCNQCQHSVCKICKSRGTHSKHPTISVKNAYKKSKACLNTLLDELKNKEVETRAEIQQLEDDVRKLEMEEADVRDEIHSAVDEMHKMLETKRIHLLESVDTTARAKEKELRRRLQDLKDDVLYSSVMAFAEEVLLETDPAYFLQTFKMIEMRTREAIVHMSKNHCSRDSAIDYSPFREIFYAERGTKLRSLLPVYIDLEKLKNCVATWDLLQIPGSPVCAAGCVGTSFTKSQDPTWQLSEHHNTADYFQVSYLNEESNSVEIESYPNDEEEFRISTSCKILSNLNNTSVRVRAANKAGVGSWSEPYVVSPKFLKRNSFKMKRSENRQNFDVVYNDSAVWLTKCESAKSGTEFTTYKGELEINTRGEYYWEIEATGAPEFTFFVGILNSGSAKSANLFEESENTSSALFLIGPRSCGVIEFSDGKLADKLNVAKLSDKLPKAISALKPLKKLKHSLLRHSGLALSMGDLRSKNARRRCSNSDEVSITTRASLSRSPSVTSLPSILQSEHSVNPIGPASWSMRRFVGRRYFRIGVDLELLEDCTMSVSFIDLTSNTATVVGSKTIKCECVEPFFAISEHGCINLM